MKKSVCVSVCGRERERERDWQIERKRMCGRKCVRMVKLV